MMRYAGLMCLEAVSKSLSSFGLTIFERSKLASLKL